MRAGRSGAGPLGPAPPRRPGRRRAAGLALAALLGLSLLAVGAPRVVRVEGEGFSQTLVLGAWQRGGISFVNSITGRPVEIGFDLAWRFGGFAMRTDPGTEEYYTAGVYDMRRQLAGQRTRELSYCSEVGMTLTLGGRSFSRPGCLRARLLWPPF